MGQKFALPEGVKTRGDHCFIVHPGNRLQQVQGCGHLILTHEALYYYLGSRQRVVGLPYSAITECTYSGSFSVPGHCIYYTPCCCSCVPNGLVDMTANVNDENIRISIAVVNAEIFVEKINDARSTTQNAQFQPMTIPSNISSEDVESTVGNLAYAISTDGKISKCNEKGTLFLTETTVYYYASPVFKNPYRFIGIPYSIIKECYYTEEYIPESENISNETKTSISEAQWTDGFINIVADMKGSEVRAIISVVLAHDFVEKINQRKMVKK